MGELTYSEDAGTSWRSSQTVAVTIAADVYEGVEGTPDSLPGGPVCGQMIRSTFTVSPTGGLAFDVLSGLTVTAEGLVAGTDVLTLGANAGGLYGVSLVASLESAVAATNVVAFSIEINGTPYTVTSPLISVPQNDIRSYTDIFQVQIPDSAAVKAAVAATSANNLTVDKFAMTLRRLAA